MRLSLLAGVGAAFAVRNAAVDKVIEMLKDMETRGKQNKQEEEVAFAKYNTFASDTKDQKKADIEASGVAISGFKAQIEAAQATAQEAQAAIDDAIDTQEKQKADVDAMTKTRAEEAELYATKRTELQDSVYASDKAIQALSAVPEKVEAASFLQLKKGSMSDKHWAAVQSLMQMVQKAADPFTAASERKSDVVIDMLKKLKDDFEEELQNATKEESNRKHQFDMHKQAAEQEIADAKKMEEEKKSEKAEAMAAEGTATKNLDTEEKSTADDKKYLQMLTTEHDQKSKDFAARQKSRAEELTAIAEAISIIEDVASSGIKAVSFSQKNSFLQLRGSDKTQRAIEFLLQRGNNMHSKVLVQVAEMAKADPFAKITRMIQELINRLEEEAAAQMTKKAKCDKDMAANKAKIEEYTSMVNKLTSKVEMLESEIAELKSTSKRLIKEIAETKDALATAKKDRSEEKAENEKTISETQAAVAAVDQAMTVLQNYYSKVEGSFVQVQQPEFESGEYKGMGGGGVLGLMEVIKSDMDSLIRETTAAEEDAATSHAEFTSESDTAIASKTTLNQSTKESLAEKESELSATKDELDGEDGAKAQLATYVKEKNEVIDPVCIAKGVSFEERQAKREEEIQSLQEALEILGQMAP